MIGISLPKWMKFHLYSNKTFGNLTEAELIDLKSRIAKFQNDDPLVSVVIPAWNEADHIFRAISSLVNTNSKQKIEIVVINNNSTDHTQEVLDKLGVRNFFEPKQGTSHARQCGLDNAKGKYHLCADSDTLYPPHWIDLMIKPMMKNSKITGVYGRYAFIPPEGVSRFSMWIYERIVGILVRIRRKNREYLNVMGFTMGLVAEIGKTTGGFKVKNVRVFQNTKDSKYFTEESEDGTMALNLKKKGRLKLVTNPKAVVITSPRRIIYDGGIWESFKQRFVVHSKRLLEYFTGKEK
jgi:glycosyltransferase involved in cell wall biosynthesis